MFEPETVAAGGGLISSRNLVVSMDVWELNRELLG